MAPRPCSTSYGDWQQLQREQDIWQKPSGASSALASNLGGRVRPGRAACGRVQARLGESRGFRRSCCCSCCRRAPPRHRPAPTCRSGCNCRNGAGRSNRPPAPGSTRRARARCAGRRPSTGRAGRWAAARRRRWPAPAPSCGSGLRAGGQGRRGAGAEGASERCGCASASCRRQLRRRPTCGVVHQRLFSPDVLARAGAAAGQQACRDSRSGGGAAAGKGSLGRAHSFHRSSRARLLLSRCPAALAWRVPGARNAGLVLRRASEPLAQQRAPMEDLTCWLWRDDRKQQASKQARNAEKMRESSY